MIFYESERGQQLSRAEHLKNIYFLRNFPRFIVLKINMAPLMLMEFCHETRNTKMTFAPPTALKRSQNIVYSPCGLSISEHFGREMT